MAALLGPTSSGCREPHEAANAFTAMTPEEHGDLFPISVGTAHALAECNDCHGGFDSFKENSCVRQCHEGVLSHTQARADLDHAYCIQQECCLGYVWNDAACKSCHPLGVIDRTPCQSAPDGGDAAGGD